MTKLLSRSVQIKPLRHFRRSDEFDMQVEHQCILAAVTQIGRGAAVEPEIVVPGADRRMRITVAQMAEFADKDDFAVCNAEACDAKVCG